MKQTTRDIRRGNQLTVLQRIYALAPISRQEITAATHLSAATVANVVTDLLEAGIIIEASFVPSAGGRPRAMLEVHATNGAFVGVDVAETYIHFELFDMGLRHRATVEHMLRSDENDPDTIVQHVVLGLHTLLEEGGVDRRKVLGVGISVPGLVERLGGVSVFAPNWGWHDVPLADMLRRHIRLPIYLDNPLKVCAMAELWFGAGRHSQNLVVLNLGTGVGAGIIVNGTVYRGMTNSAGEWGHTTVEPDGRACRCGSKGCIEAYVGAPGIIQTLRDLAPRSPLLRFAQQTAIIDAIGEAAEHADHEATAVIKWTARYLGIGMANMMNLFNPEVMILGSWVGMRLGPLLLPEAWPIVRQYALKQVVDVATIQLCQLPHHPISMGAASLALEGFLTNGDTNVGHTA